MRYYFYFMFNFEEKKAKKALLYSFSVIIWEQTKKILD